MSDFIKRNWFVLTLSLLAAAAIVVSVFFPPAFLAAITIGIASSAAFEALGAAAVPVAIASVAAVSAAAVFAAGAILRGIANFLGWAADKVFGKAQDVTTATATVAAPNGPTSAARMHDQLAPRPNAANEPQKGAPAQNGPLFQAPKPKAVPAAEEPAAAPKAAAGA